VRVKAQHACIDLTKSFMKRIIKYFVCLDTLKTILAKIKKLILKSHHINELIELPEDPRFENHLNVDIPKKLKVTFEEGVTFIMTDSSRKLKPFLNPDPKAMRGVEVMKWDFASLGIELLKTLKDSYYVNLVSQRMKVGVNGEEGFTIEQFQDETDFAFKREIN